MSHRKSIMSDAQECHWKLDRSIAKWYTDCGESMYYSLDIVQNHRFRTCPFCSLEIVRDSKEGFVNGVYKKV